MTKGDARWDGMTDEEFVADLVARHGVEAARAMAKAMALPPPRQGPKPEKATRVGRKPKYRRGIPVPTYGHGRPSAKDLNDLRRLMPPREHVQRLYVKRGRPQACALRSCGRKLWAGDEVAWLLPSGRRVHSECIAAALASG